MNSSNPVSARAGLGPKHSLTSSDSWRLAAKIAWREARASSSKFLFVVLAVALGVGVLSGVRGFCAAFRQMLLRDARILMAADISARIYHEPSPDEQRALDDLVSRGATITNVIETPSMMNSPAVSRPLLVSVKAVDPTHYPFYGEIELIPSQDLSTALTPTSVVVSDDLILRLGVEVGDSVRLGDESFQIAGILSVEPDRMTGSMNVGPRVMLSEQALDRTGLIRLGSRASQRFLVKLPLEGLTVDQARTALQAGLPGSRVADFRETHPTIRRGLDRATNFLSLVSLIAMIVGGLGVAMAMYSHLQQRLDTIAIMKCVGARSAQIVRIFALQALALGTLGSLIGVAVGLIVQGAAPIFVARYFPGAPALEWQPWAAIQAGSVGVLTALLFSLPTLLSIRNIRPALIFRRDMEGTPRSWKVRRKEWQASLSVGAIIVAAMGTIAAWLGDSLELGGWFALGLVGSLAAMGITAWALLRALKALPNILPMRLPTALRHGIANLYRPGVHAEAILVALGIGVTFTLSVYLIQTTVLSQLIRSAPPDMPNVFLVNITEEERGPLEELLRNHPGVNSDAELLPSVAARLISIDGEDLESRPLQGWNRRFRSTRAITWSDQLPEEIEVITGEWWGDQPPENVVSVREGSAEVLDLSLGSVLKWRIGAKEVSATVTATHRVEGIRPGSSNDFVLNHAALEGFPTIYFGGIRVDPDQAVELQRKAFELFPSVSVINAADVLRIVQEVVDQISVVIRFVSSFAILAGVIILVSSVVSTRFRRIREVAVLKTLGATRSKVGQIFSVEFLILGTVAGLIGSFLATGFSVVLLEQFLEAESVIDWMPNVVTVVATALIANVAGWGASFRILGRKPLEVLRGE